MGRCLGEISGTFGCVLYTLVGNGTLHASLRPPHQTGTSSSFNRRPALAVAPNAPA